MRLAREIERLRQRVYKLSIEKDPPTLSMVTVKDEEKRLTLNASQAKLTYHQLIEFGYKLRKPKIEITSKD